MSVPRARFREGPTWDEWLELLETERSDWERRFDEARLGELRADYQDVPTPRYVLCLFDPEDPASRELVPLIAKACDQAGEAGAVEVRFFPRDENRDIVDQYLTGGTHALPLCVVFDQAWIQVGLWHHHRRRDGEDAGRRALRELVAELRGEGTRPWRAHQNLVEHVWKQAERAREERP